MVFRTASLLALALLVIVNADDNPNVLVLTDSTIDEAIANNEVIMIKFYAPWCGHCKRLAPEYDKAADLLVGKGSKAKLAKVDATVEKTSASTYGVRGYPTVLLFKNGA